MIVIDNGGNFTVIVIDRTKKESNNRNGWSSNK